MWDPLQWELEVYFCANHWILTILRNKNSTLRFSIFNIYMPNRYMEKLECWSSLFSIKDTLDITTIIVVGDLNIFLQNSEKRGGNCVLRPHVRKFGRSNFRLGSLGH
jgi:hypothetical protein